MRLCRCSLLRRMLGEQMVFLQGRRGIRRLAFCACGVDFWGLWLYSTLLLDWLDCVTCGDDRVR